MTSRASLSKGRFITRLPLVGSILKYGFRDTWRNTKGLNILSSLSTDCYRPHPILKPQYKIPIIQSMLFSLLNWYFICPWIRHWFLKKWLKFPINQTPWVGLIKIFKYWILRLWSGMPDLVGRVDTSAVITSKGCTNCKNTFDWVRL